MRIISDFHDYYDGAMAFGQDMRVVYERRTAVGPASARLAKLLRSMPGHALRVHSSRDLRMVPYLVVVAGKAHLGYERRPGSAVSQPGGDVHGIDAVLATPGLPPARDKRGSFDWWDGSERYSFNRKGLEQATEALSRMDLVEDCIALKAPLLMVRFDGNAREVEVVRNPELRSHRFGVVMDAYALFQEIDMFVSGVMPAAGREMVTLSDEDRRDKGGFDEWSFRRHPGDAR